MLGNFSFGDYFKKEAIDWAWELLTEVYGMPKDRLYATVFEGAPEEDVPMDQEAYDYWKQYLPEDHIILGNKHDNFWEMGETGPCGPCSEIHFDLRSEEERAAKPGSEMVNMGHHLVIEIWNLVFMQFNRKANGSLEPLPHKHIDTGMGFERLCMVLQNKQSNYDTDVFQTRIAEIAALSGKKYGDDEKADIAMRVIADHLRTISFSIADGQLPSNVKAGYVIRRILRRAVRYGYTYLGFNEPFICKLVPGLVEQMGEQFPELKAQQNLIVSVICEEESAFLKTLATGINLLEGVIAKVRKAGGNTIDGKSAFTLYDTYGFPIDLTELIAKENGMGVDLEAFDVELQAQKARSRNAAVVENDDWVELQAGVSSEFVGYDSLTAEVKIVRYRRVTTKGKTLYQLVFDRTPFYANSGGQVGDNGTIEAAGKSIKVVDTIKENGLPIHIVAELPEDVNATFVATVNEEDRLASARHHSVTHLMHKALRDILGTHVEQKGSLVCPDYLRFDFSHFQKVTDEELRQVEKAVNKMIRANYALEENRNCSIEEAQQAGAMMLFGEKYGDKVRMIRFGESVELCGGTHVAATGQIGLFKIVAESAISAGVRRIEAVAGGVAEEKLYTIEDTLKEVQKSVGSPALLQAIKKMIDDNAELRKEIEGFRAEKARGLADAIGKIIAESDQKVFSRVVDMPVDMVKDAIYALRTANPEVAIVLGSREGGKPMLAVAVGDALVAKGVKAGDIVRTAAKEMQGGGGGQPFYATAGGKNPEGLEKAIAVAEELILTKL
ncbi:MAG: alanine--tRNA ligase, partial [Tidjanibacter sp.]|nr:alanine--tRNA ligase [Tidjanibacter sp.]